MSQPAKNWHDEWKEVWDWAEKIWGESTEEDKREIASFSFVQPERAAAFTFGWFMRRIASQIASNEGLEEVGSSDVWHLTYGCVKTLMTDPKVKTRDDLKNRLCDWYGCHFY